MIMKGGFEIKMKSRGLLRTIAGGESLFVNTYVSKESNGKLWLVPPWPRDIEYITIEGGQGSNS